MTVKELIEELKKIPKDVEVMFIDNEYGGERHIDNMVFKTRIHDRKIRIVALINLKSKT